MNLIVRNSFTLHKTAEYGTHLSEASADGTGLLWSEVKGGVLLLLVEVTDGLPLLLVGDGKNPGNGLADGVTAWHKLVLFGK